MGIWYVLVLIVLLVIAYFLLKEEGLFVGGGGTAGSVSAGSAGKADAVVDLLNLTHWLRKKGESGPLAACEQFDAIAKTAAPLRSQYRRVAYVTKLRHSADAAEARRTRAAAATTAKTHGVEVAVVEPGIADAPKVRAGEAPGHAAVGQDDYYAAWLATERSADMITNDKLRDLREMADGGLGDVVAIRYVPRYIPGGSNRPPKEVRDVVRPSAASLRNVAASSRRRRFTRRRLPDALPAFAKK